MNALIVVTPEYHNPFPLICNLGEHTLIITNSYSDATAFEFAAPVITSDDCRADGETPTQELTILDHEEGYHLYQCLHELFHPKS